MNTIKPQSLIVGFLIVGILWFMEVSNRPDSIPDYKVQSDHLSGSALRTAATDNSRRSDVEQRAGNSQAQQDATKKNIPLTAKMLVANRGEFFASTHVNALPAQEQAQLGMIPKPVEKEAPKTPNRQHPEKCLSPNCIGPGISDY